MNTYVIAYRHGNENGSTCIDAMDMQSALDKFVIWFGETEKMLCAWIDHQINVVP